MDPLAYSVSDVLNLLGISRTTFYRLVKAGALKARKVGKRTVVLTRDLNDYLDGLPTMGGEG